MPRKQRSDDCVSSHRWTASNNIFDKGRRTIDGEPKGLFALRTPRNRRRRRKVGGEEGGEKEDRSLEGSPKVRARSPFVFHHSGTDRLGYLWRKIQSIVTLPQQSLYAICVVSSISSRISVYLFARTCESDTCAAEPEQSEHCVTKSTCSTYRALFRSRSTLRSNYDISLRSNTFAILEKWQNNKTFKGILYVFRSNLIRVMSSVSRCVIEDTFERIDLDGRSYISWPLHESSNKCNYLDCVRKSLDHGALSYAHFLLGWA